MGLADELQRLTALHRDGTLTDEEFARAKAALLEAPRVAASEAPGAGEAAPSEQAQRQWAMFVHLSLLAGLLVPLAGYVLPIVFWQIKKAEMPGLDAHGRMVANWMISSLIYWAASIALVFVVVGIPLLIVLGVVSVVFPVIGGLKANDGELWNYPMTIKFL